MGTWEDGQKTRAEAQAILLDQLKLLQEQSKKIGVAGPVPAANLAAISHEMAEIGRVLMDSGRATK